MANCFRYPSIALGGLATYFSSAISWVEETPASTSVIVQTSTDGETFATISNGDPIDGLSLSDPLVGVDLTIRVELQSIVPGSTPIFDGTSLQVLVLGEPPSLRGPTGHYDFGSVLWTSGANNGLAMEIKLWDDITQAVQLFLPMPFDIAVEDTLEFLPGCDKLLSTCDGKYGNSVNARMEPFVPGEDQIRKFPDAQT